MSDDLSLLKTIRETDRFDLGELNLLPFSGRAKLWKWWRYPFVLLFMFLIGVVLISNFDSAFVRSEIEYHGHIDQVWRVILTPVLGGLELYLLYLVVSMPFLGLTVKIDGNQVEVWQRGLDWRKRHFREPLRSYTAVQLRNEFNESSLSDSEMSAEWPVHAVYLQHADDDKIITLYRGNEKTARRRWKNAAGVLGLPAVES
jgi:hypothetical protein